MSRVAVRVARAYEELGIGWLEEPFEPDEYEAYAELADSVDLPIAAGEQDSTRWGFRELIERGHVDVVQPDVTRAGGITETLRIAALAREHGVATVPHAWKSGIIKAASLHVNAVLPDGDLPGVLRRRDADQHPTDGAAAAGRRRRLRRGADCAGARRRSRRGRRRDAASRRVTAACRIRRSPARSISRRPGAASGGSCSRARRTRRAGPRPTSRSRAW